MRHSRSERAIPLLLAALAYGLAFLQRPGEASSDTKIDLHVDPTGFLADVAAIWTPTGSLGHVQGGQYGGYLWPMGPFFAALHELGLSAWIVQRLWLGTVLALAAWGAVRLMDALAGRPRGVAHLVTGAVFLLNPYVVVFSNRTSVTLLGYAALPWLLLAVQRGLRSPRSWWWPAAFALIVTSTSGGVNAATTAWMLLGPLLLLLYEPFVAGLPWRDVRAFALRTAAVTALASVWWTIPVVVHAGYGLDFLRFTEQAGSIWNTTSLTESLRLMGYWPSYLGAGYGDDLRPYFGDSPTLLFDSAVVTASLLVPGLALAGFVWTRRWRYGPFFVGLALLGLLVMSVGYPEGTPLRRAANFAYSNLDPVQFLRTTYKAGPLVAMAIAALAGAAAAELWRRLGSRALPRAALAGAAAVLLVLASLPLFQGRAIDSEFTWEEIPGAWTSAAADLDRELPESSRAAVLPAQLFAFYHWGATVDPILPALSKRPVAVRNVPPYSDLHAVDLLWTVDALVQQRRLLPGQLPPLLSLLGVRSVVTATDDDARRSGALPPAEAARELAGQAGFERPARSYGEPRSFSTGSLEPPLSLPEVRRYDLPAARPLVRVQPAAPETVVDGSARGLAALASFGALPERGALAYAGDRDAEDVRRAADEGAAIVVSDSNRRQAFVTSRARQSAGAVLAESDEVSDDGSYLDPFDRGTDGQTVAVYRGARHVRAPFSPQIAQFPEQRPYAAFDGNPETYWLADPTLEDDRHWIEIGLSGRRDVEHIDVRPHVDPRATVTAVEVDGERHDVQPGWNRLEVGLSDVDSVRVEIAGQTRSGDDAGSAGGFDEIRIPGVGVTELLRPPVLAERALAGHDVSRSELTYLFERTTADDPFRRNPAPPPPPREGDRAEAEAALIRGAQDPEEGMRRAFSPPAARSWEADGWVTVAPDAPDNEVDALVGARSRRGIFQSSGRFEGRPGFRASGAFDRGDRSWVAPWRTGRPAWISWEMARPRTLRRLTLEPPPVPAQVPTRVRLSANGGAASPPLAVRRGAGGRRTIDVPGQLRGRRFQLDVLAAEPAPGASTRPAVAIGELRGPGVPRARRPRASALPCSAGGAISGRSLGLRPTGSLRDFDAGRPLKARSCFGPIALGAGRQELRVDAGVLRVHSLRLRSAAPEARPAPPGGGRVLDPGTQGRGKWDGVRVEVDAPSRLVLGESFNRGWRASCDGDDLGEPEVVDGFANGWRVEPGCEEVEFAFAPQRFVDAGYAVGGLACLALLALVLVGTRRRSPAPGSPPADLAVDDSPRRFPLRQALIGGALAGALFGFVFALRAGVLIGPGVALILWRGFSPRQLILAAGALLALVVPALYLLFPAEDRGGYNNEYAVEHLGAHWVAVAAFVLLVLALAGRLSTASRRSGGRARARAGAGAGRGRA